MRPKVVVQGKEHEVRFRHYPSIINPVGTTTQAFLSPPVEDSMKGRLFAGRSYCHPNDNFSRAFGRKLAFRRLLEQLGVPRTNRRAAWLSYYEALPRDVGVKIPNAKR